MRSSPDGIQSGRRIVLLFAAAILLAACQRETVAGAEQADRLEPGLQGQTLPEDLAVGVLPEPYTKGVRLIGHSPVYDRDSNVQMSWIDHCAYISSVHAPMPFIAAMKADPALLGVAVIDVRDPKAPRAVRLLRDKGSIRASETMHAVAAPDRKVLAAGAYGGGSGANNEGPDDDAWLSIYDASDCANPKLTAEYQWPENVHAVTVSANGRRVYGTHIEPFSGRGGIHVLDISDMARPRYIGKFGATRPDGTSFEFATHEISIGPDETRIYAGVIGSRGGDLNRDFKSPDGTPAAERVGREAGGIYVLDNSDIADGRPDPRMRLIGTAEHGGWHSVMPANIKGVPHLVGGGELGPCPGAWPKIVNIADETKPFIAGEFKLAMNLKENCPPQTATEKAGMGFIGDAGTATLHFNDVDSADATRLGLFQFMWAGLRIADLSDPADPVEIAYFKPGDACGGHVRYVPETEHIWFACGQSGFYVIELAPEVRAALRR